MPVTFVVLQGTFSPAEHDWFVHAVAQWNDALQAVKPAIALTVASSPVAGHRNVEVSIDPGLAWAGATWRGTGDWWIRLNPAQYEVSQSDLLPEYLKGLYLHELGHLAGFGHVDGLRTDSIMGVEDVGGSYAGRATCLLGGDLCAVGLLYGERE